MMLGALAGDIAGSVYEFHNIHTQDFPLFSKKCRPTDDSVMTLAIADALLKSAARGFADLKAQAVASMLSVGRRYPRCGYGGGFRVWMFKQGDRPEPYGSYGNGAPMRVSPVGYAARSEDEVIRFSHAVTEVSHNHPRALKAAECTAMGIFALRQGCGLKGLKDLVLSRYYADLPSFEELMEHYEGTQESEDTVKPALSCLFASDSFKSCLRRCIAIGGDSDTLAAIGCSLAAPCFGVPKEIEDQALAFLDPFLRQIHSDFMARFDKAPSVQA
ncbi:MAG: ADP-ribosylglycohydrolase family protein [Succinivibrio sp.]|jgi:type I restriction enzyme M protein|nr:ADP-ribosylglycohydrolase family protein [Succinivibrio sp.]